MMLETDEARDTRWTIMKKLKHGLMGYAVWVERRGGGGSPCVDFLLPFSTTFPPLNIYTSKYRIVEGE